MIKLLKYKKINLVILLIILFTNFIIYYITKEYITKKYQDIIITEGLFPLGYEVKNTQKFSNVIECFEVRDSMFSNINNLKEVRLVHCIYKKGINGSIFINICKDNPRNDIYFCKRTFEIAEDGDTLWFDGFMSNIYDNKNKAYPIIVSKLYIQNKTSNWRQMIFKKNLN